MITLDLDKGKFSLRAAGLVIHNGKVLLHKFERYDYWLLPGGRAELLEDTKETIIREMKEELNEEVTVERLLCCCEDFFTRGETQFHQLCFYYLIHIDEAARLLDISDEFELAELDGTLMIFKWFEFDDIRHIDLVPEIFEG
jgi:8-oxo-dGTP pyrophosphatase MutT (NUDIX family)